MRNPFNKFDMNVWSTSLINKINNSLKRRRSDDNVIGGNSKHQKVDDVFDSNGVRHDDHLHLHSTKLNDDDDEIVYPDNNLIDNDDDDNKANDDYWIGEDPADDRDDNVLPKHEFDKGYDDDSESDQDEQDEVDNLDYISEDDQVDSNSNSNSNSNINLTHLDHVKQLENDQDNFGEQVVGEVDDDSNSDSDRVYSDSDNEQEQEQEYEKHEKHPHEHTKNTAKHNETIDLSSDSD
ncbi:hypothetical protein E3P96_03063 [Wallemia ichthyophaga]|nr:hypothetical protein E3P96_03063 [Wallemia ichthyophaga]